MRRKMHAVAFLLAIASPVLAQSSSEEAVSPKSATTPSSQSQSAEVHDEAEFADGNATHFAARQSHVTTPWGPRDPGYTQSQLAAYMNCSNWSPNLWNNYANERACIAARISQHVEMQCKCFDGQCRLHSKTSCLGSSDCNCGNCKTGKLPIAINRYRQPLSKLHTAASDSCGAATSCPSNSCSACGDVQNQGTSLSYPTSATRPLTPIIANPPRNRVATPAVDKSGSFSILNAEPSSLCYR